MKTEMRRRYQRIFLLLGVIGLLVALSPAYSQEKFRLKPGASGKLCLTCHANFGEKLKNKFVHTPVKTGQCSGCHNPHASAHGKLLQADTNEICNSCHGRMVGESALSAHQPTVEGKCVSCHDPHASANRFNLVKGGNKLCFECHADMSERTAKLEFPHSPAKSSCLNCHNPHASDNGKSLLASNEPSLCLACHQTDKPVFARLHMNYPVANQRCTTCHDPHGSDRAAILYDNVHMPVANKMCNQCHEEPTSRNPFETRKKGYELCGGCHSNMVNESFGKNRIHWPMVSAEGCLSCHNPHASTQKLLLKDSMINLCGNCHSDTAEGMNSAKVQHPPVKAGTCSSCHSPHASEEGFLLKEPTPDICGRCHDWKKTHPVHPIGEKVVDPRNRNLSVDCPSCHQSHGSENQYMTHFDYSTDLCVQCHIRFKE